MTAPPTIVGRYHVERLIAHGGMGSVYLARDPAIDRQVVIKLLKEGFDDAAARERFAREARSAGRLQHPNIVTVFDVGEYEDRPFIAMEYVQGETLAELIKRDRLLRMSEKLEILEDVCTGLHYAHVVGIVHRDIKPANVMRVHSGIVKVLDFGVARAGTGPVTRAGDVIGTLNYMSPEQLAGEPVDHRTDVYSVGALAYELFTLRMAFPGTIDTGVLHKILTSSVVPIEDLVPGIDPDIAALVERAMALDVDARYQDLEEMRQDVADVRARVLESGPEFEEPIDPNAETRVDSSRLPSGPRPSSRRSSTAGRAAESTASRPASAVAAADRPKSTVLLGVVCAALAGALVATLVLNRPAAGPSVGTESPAPEQASPQRPAPRETGPPGGPNVAAERPAGDGNVRLEEQLSAARDAVRSQMIAGARQGALDALVRGLALDAKDPALNGLAEDLTVAARRGATEARTAASERGANALSSAEFRSAQARERAAESSVRAGDRVQGIRALWAAAALYNSSRGAAGQPVPAAPLPAPPEPAPVAPVIPSPPDPGAQVPTVPLRDPLETPQPKVTAPAPAPPAPIPDTPPALRESPPDPRAVELSAIREALRRYTLAYQSMSSAAVAKVMPSLNREQLRSLDRDFSSYRRYAVEIRDERIAVDGAVATVTCQVVRSFETKTGVTGSNTVASTFHFRRTGTVWMIERLESR